MMFGDQCGIKYCKPFDENSEKENILKVSQKHVLEGALLAENWEYAYVILIVSMPVLVQTIQ